MQKVSPKIAVIGAGPCGLTTVKNLLQMGLTNVTVFEQQSELGGNWVYQGHPHSSIYETTHLISSKYLSAFVDFPMPRSYPDYPSHREVLAYFQAYAARFELSPYIRFNTRVLASHETPDKSWVIRFQDPLGEEKEEHFTHLFVANGHHWKPLMPTEITFGGKILHSHDYKTARDFENERVLVVGGGNSACDIAVEIARVAKKTAISIRRGQHIFPKFIFGKPTDVAFSFVDWMPFRLKQTFSKAIIRLLQGRYAKYGLLLPKEPPLMTHPVINSELLYSIRHGKVASRPGIQRIENEQVFFQNGLTEAFDTMIFATGYEVSFPFFTDSRLHFSRQETLPLYLKMMHPAFDTLYFIGLFQPQGSIWPLADYQAKIAAQIIAGKMARPDNMPKKIFKEQKERMARYHHNVRHALEVDYGDFQKVLLNVLKSKSRELV